jgi:hypothetical protein
MDVINTFHIEKTQEGRRKKQKLTEVEAPRVNREEHERRKKSPHYRNPKRVTFENEETPNEDFVEISPNEVITPHKNNKQDKQKRVMANDESIPIDYEEIVDLDETHLNHKRKKSIFFDDVREAIVSSEYYSEIPKGSRETITPGVYLEDGIMKTTQNTIQNRLMRTNLVEDGHTF